MDELFLAGALGKAGLLERKTMIDGSHKLALAGQAKVLGISRGSVYYLARPTSDADLALMRRIDELHLEHPFAGSRMLREMLKAFGLSIAGIAEVTPSVTDSTGLPGSGELSLRARLQIDPAPQRSHSGARTKKGGQPLAQVRR